MNVADSEGDIEDLESLASVGKQGWARDTTYDRPQADTRQLSTLTTSPCLGRAAGSGMGYQTACDGGGGKYLLLPLRYWMFADR
jgi:hypothetical protein